MKEIVIKLSDERYELLQAVSQCLVLEEHIAILDGIVLPEGHGDLIDRSKLVPDCYELEIHDGEDWRNEYCGVSLMQIELDAEVIIEADRGNK